MARYYAEENVINGTWAELWINGELVANCIGLQAKVSLKTGDINMCRTLAKHTKVVGYEGKGTLKLNKVDSLFIKMMSDNIKKGKQTKCTIVSKLADPDALGIERICLKDCVFEELTLANWEAKKNEEESIPFSFSDWEPVDLI
ncbi:phage portal protein [Clostridium tetani]|uniref:phage tail tube protein n=1 Tax=Clostridium tetani TaxID=1513 RepID=UPI00100C0628|nr:phage tail tube protein [Clostridium tetani]RXI57240.1 phage portal protein [Clostridium tetani]